MLPPVVQSRPGTAPLEQWVGQVARTLNMMLSGKLNATNTVTLTPNAKSTVLIDSRVGIGTVVDLSPRSLSAATAKASGSLVFQTAKGAVTIYHPASSAIDQTFSVLLIG